MHLHSMHNGQVPQIGDIFLRYHIIDVPGVLENDVLHACNDSCD